MFLKDIAFFHVTYLHVVVLKQKAHIRIDLSIEGYQTVDNKNV